MSHAAHVNAECMYPLACGPCLLYGCLPAVRLPTCCRLEGDAVKLSWAALSDDGGTSVLDWKVMHAELISTGVQVRRSTDSLQHAP